MTALVLASFNEKKLQELNDILKDLPLKILSLSHWPDPPRAEEDGESFEANARKKALTIARWSGKLALADDSGLCVDLLGGAPGIYSARFAGAEQDDRANCEKLLALLRGVPEKERGASFQCAIALASPEHGIIGVARGEYRGWIAFDMKGTSGFGYDPLFVDPESGKRFAELEPALKNRISHRAEALAKAREIIRRYLSGS